jgi:signal transduction histidine kinase/DNA-binding response OmpR family regulator
LRFRSDELEEAFRAEYARRSMRLVRYALVLGVLIYGPLFGVVDYVSLPAFAPTAWAVRGAVCVAGLAVLAFTYAPAFERWMQPTLSGLLLLAGLGLVLMLALEPSGEYYFEGPVLLILPTYVIVRLRFAWASAVGWLVVVAYVVVVALFKDVAAGEVVSGAIFIGAANLIGMFAGYMLEDYARRQFWQARLIDEKRAENAELLEARSRFFANVSHELRTPLTLILGPLDDVLGALEDRRDDGGAQREASALAAPLRRVRRNARRLQRLIDQLLDLAKLEAGHLQFQPRRGRLAPFVRGVTESFAEHAEREGIDLQFSADEEASDLALDFDPDKLETVAVNLLSNALKFTPEGGTVRVSVEREDGGAASLRVRDTGPGIPAEELPHLFDRFHQAADSTLRQKEGTGIGLAFAKELTELHGGEIDVESEPGFGTEFTVRLPVECESAGGRERGSAGEGKGERQAEETLAGGEVERDEVEETTGEAATEGATVLVVEDNADVRAYVRDGLGETHEVREAADGREGLEVARAVVPDLVVTDVMMPGMDGYAFCRTLKEDPVLDHIPVVMLTAKAEREHRIEGLEAGADAYLGKPFSRRELQVRVENLLADRRRLRKRFSDEVLVQPSEVDVPSADERFIERAREAVEEHMGDADFDVDAFAEAVGMSRRQLQRKLKAVADQTPSAFVRRIRLGRGAQLLAQDYGTVSEIAYEVGFGSPSYFTKCFRETFGTTPSRYEPEEE